MKPYFLTILYRLDSSRIHLQIIDLNQLSFYLKMEISLLVLVVFTLQFIGERLFMYSVCVHYI